MVIDFHNRKARQRGMLTGELLVAVSLLVVAVMPIAYSLRGEIETARGYYERAVAMEIVDGEMEVLLAGGWKALGPGTREYPVHAAAAKNLEGAFTATIGTNSIRLEWTPAEKHHGGPVVREVKLK
ncbi:MAG TPA: hypothetical protein VK327_06275 [Candidatus Paceibacterota bacterium]|nr:hypothetical protein [Candidatus Paceibacterota bacterium]